jgi:hypothetical protein
MGFLRTARNKICENADQKVSSSSIFRICSGQANDESVCEGNNRHRTGQKLPSVQCLLTSGASFVTKLHFREMMDEPERLRVSPCLKQRLWKLTFTGGPECVFSWIPFAVRRERQSNLFERLVVRECHAARDSRANALGYRAIAPRQCTFRFRASGPESSFGSPKRDGNGRVIWLTGLA